MKGYSDSDWGGEPATYRSTAGLVFNIEYQAQTQAAKEAVWLRSLLQELNPAEPMLYATIIYCDNQVAIALTKDPEFHPRTKHIAIQHHWVREKIAEEVVDLEYVETSKQMADGLKRSERCPRSRKDLRAKSNSWYLRPLTDQSYVRGCAPISKASPTKGASCGTSVKCTRSTPIRASRCFAHTPRASAVQQRRTALH